MEKRNYAIPDYATAKDIKNMRNLLNMTQNEFANFIGCSKPTIERWEKEDSKITGPIVLLLNMLENNIDYIEKIKIPNKIFPLRLYYMFIEPLMIKIIRFSLHSPLDQRPLT